MKQNINISDKTTDANIKSEERQDIVNDITSQVATEIQPDKKESLIDIKKIEDIEGYEYLQSFLELIRIKDNDKKIIKKEYTELTKSSREFLDNKLKSLSTSDREIDDEIKKMEISGHTNNFTELKEQLLNKLKK